MSYSRQDEWMDDLRETNARIVTRQCEALDALNRFDYQLQGDDPVPLDREDIHYLIRTLKGT